MNNRSRPTDLVASAPRQTPPSRLRRITLVLAALLTVLVLAPVHAKAAAGGTCTFGTSTSPGPLNFTMTSSRITITGSGPCTGTFGSNAVSVALDGAGTFGCDFGLGGMSGAMLWSPAPPAGQGTFQVRIATVANVVYLVINDTGFYATATLAWPATDLPSCIASGTESAQLTGSMSFVTT